jgi:hypothetical protein
MVVVVELEVQVVVVQLEDPMQREQVVLLTQVVAVAPLAIQMARLLAAADREL